MCWHWRGRWRQRRMRRWSQRRMMRFPKVLESARGTSLAPAMCRLPGVMMLRLHGLALIAGRVLVVAPRWGAALRRSLSRHRLGVAWQAGVLTSVMMVLTVHLTRPLLRSPPWEAPRDGPPYSSPGVAPAPLCSAARPGRGGGVGGAHPGGQLAGSGGAGAARFKRSGHLGGGLAGW